MLSAQLTTKFTPLSKHFEEKEHYYLLRAGKLEPRWTEAIFVPSAVWI